MYNENCEDYDGYKKRRGKPAYVQKGFRKVWAEDAIMEGKLKCLDEAHSTYNEMNQEQIKKLEKDLMDYANREGKPLCPMVERDVLHCIKINRAIQPCKREIDRFLTCVNKTVAYIYQSDHDKIKRANR